MSLKRRKSIWRTVVLRGDQTLDDLHETIFTAFDRDDEHLYSFYFPNAAARRSQRGARFRVLAAHAEVRERRAQRRRPVYTAPELLATGPNQLWSWDITKLKGPTTWSWYHLYVILDVFSRYAVGWMIAPHESAALAEKLIGTCCAREGITREQLTLHADRGSSMTSKPVALLLAELGVTKSHTRPHVSNDHPYSEAQFKTMKYRPDFPARFGSVEDARAHAVDFFRWYNTEYHHRALGLHTPYDVHHHPAAARNAARAQVLTAADAAHPERFVRRPPTPRPLPTAAWINPPLPGVASDDDARTVKRNGDSDLIARIRARVEADAPYVAAGTETIWMAHLRGVLGEYDAMKAQRDAAINRTPSFVPLPRWYLVDDRGNVYQQRDRESAERAIAELNRKDPQHGLSVTRLFREAPIVAPRTST